MVGGRGITLVGIDASHELRCGVFRQLLDDVDALSVLTLGIDDFDGLVLVAKHTAVSYLTTHLSVERGIVEHQLVELVLLLCHLAVAQDVAVVFGVVIAHELLLDRGRILGNCGNCDPVAVFHGGGIAGTLLLLLHLDVELLLINGKAVLTADELREVEGEAVGVEEAEGLDAVQDELGVGCWVLGVGLYFCHGFVEQGDTLVEGAQEAVFLFLDDLGDELLLGLQLGEGVAHLFHQGGHETVEESFFLSEEGVGIAHGTAQDAADDVACLCIRGQLTVSYREGNGTQVVCTDTHSDVDFLLSLISLIGPMGFLGLKGLIRETRELLLHLDDGLEDVSIVVGVLTLQHADQTFEAHTRIDNVHRQRLQRTIGLAVELHEHDVPYLDDLRIVLVHEVATADTAGLALLGGTAIDMYLGAGTTGTCVAHLPEVVVLVAVDDVVGRHVLCPILRCLVVTGNILFRRALEHRHVEVFRVQLQHVHQILPRHVDGPFLEVVAERPVAQHLEHGVVIGVVTYLLQVVVLTADAQTLLRIGTAARFRVAGTQNDIFPLVHTCVGEHQRGVVLDNHRCRGHDGVLLRLKELLE